MPLPFNIESVAKQVGVKSAVNASLWCCLVISLPLFFLSSQTVGLKSIAFFFVALLPLFAFIFSYIYFLFKNPNYLRSEGYHLRADALRLFGDRDNPLRATADNAISVITNPQLPVPTVSQPNNSRQISSPDTSNE